MTLWSRGILRSHDKLKALCLHSHSAYGHQTWEYVELPWGAPLHKVTEPFDLMVFQGHPTNENRYIATATVPMATKLGRMVTYLDGLLPMKSHDPLITWSCEITGSRKPLYFHNHSAYGHQTWRGGDLTVAIITWTFNHVFLRDHLRNQSVYLH